MGYLIEQISRHGLRQTLAAHQYGYLAGVLGEMEGGLARGIRPSDNVDLLVRARGGLSECRAIIDAAAGQAFRARPATLSTGASLRRAAESRTSDSDPFSGT